MSVEGTRIVTRIVVQAVRLHGCQRPATSRVIFLIDNVIYSSFLSTQILPVRLLHLIFFLYHLVPSLIRSPPCPSCATSLFTRPSCLHQCQGPQCLPRQLLPPRHVRSRPSVKAMMPSSNFADVPNRLQCAIYFQLMRDIMGTLLEAVLQSDRCTNFSLSQSNALST